MLLIIVIITVTLTGCHKPETPKPTKDMVVKPTEFSEETASILSILDEEIYFVDYNIDDTVKSIEITAWVYEDELWTNFGTSVDSVTDKNSGQIAIKYWKITMNYIALQTAVT